MEARVCLKVQFFLLALNALKITQKGMSLDVGSSFVPIRFARHHALGL